MSKHNDDLLVGHFGIKKTRKLVARKYYYETLRHDIEVYITVCNIYLASKIVKHKPYGNL